MFENSLFIPERRFRRQAAVFPLVLLVHAAAAALLVTLPLMRGARLPDIGLTAVFIAPPPPEPPPAPPKGRGGKVAAQNRIRAINSPRPFSPGILRAPVNIPVEIDREQLWGSGIEGGVEGGVDYGSDPAWKNILPDWMLAPAHTDEHLPVRAVGPVSPPRLVRRVEPSYPEIARQARVEGVVILEAATDVFGRVTKVSVLRSIPLLDQAAVDAVKQWIYEPMVVNGRPRPVVFTVTVRFDLK